MHRILTTRGLVLTKRAVGESHTQLLLLTDTLGLVRVMARSARKEVSKLRYGLEPLSTARYSVVRGRHEWKLTGVEGVSRECQPTTRAARTQVGNIAKLLVRLLPGEDVVPGLFALVSDGCVAFSKITDPMHMQALECVVVLRILTLLGYVSPLPELAPFIESAMPLSEPGLLSDAAELRPALVRLINESLATSGL